MCIHRQEGSHVMSIPSRSYMYVCHMYVYLTFLLYFSDVDIMWYYMS